MCPRKENQLSKEKVGDPVRMSNRLGGRGREDVRKSRGYHYGVING